MDPSLLSSGNLFGWTCSHIQGAIQCLHCGCSGCSCQFNIFFWGRFVMGLLSSSSGGRSRIVLGQCSRSEGSVSLRLCVGQFSNTMRRINEASPLTHQFGLCTVRRAVWPLQVSHNLASLVNGLLITEFLPGALKATGLQMQTTRGFDILPWQFPSTEEATRRVLSANNPNDLGSERTFVCIVTLVKGILPCEGEIAEIFVPWVGVDKCTTSSKNVRITGHSSFSLHFAGCYCLHGYRSRDLR
mmetsp:Transcript_44423/g.135401  ORF Transcript_44423/g.135401 Transcript_44423/m.135401 type:complete len:243 (-) Transcript_44423:1319-2047(-)